MTESVSASLIAQIVDIEDRDGPRAALTVLARRLDSIRREQREVPSGLVRLEQCLQTECCALSQGR